MGRGCGRVRDTVRPSPSPRPDSTQESIKALADLTRLVRGYLSGLHRRIIAALITIDVHARDIVMDLIKRRTKDVNEFEWQMQLRYAMENDEDLVVRQVRGWEEARGGAGAATRVAVQGRRRRVKRALVVRPTGSWAHPIKASSLPLPSPRLASPGLRSTRGSSTPTSTSAPRAVWWSLP